MFKRSWRNTVVDNSQEYRLKYWVTRSSIRSFARTAHSFACSGLLALLAPSSALTGSLARSLRSLPCSWDIGTVNDWMAILSVFFSIFDHSASLRFNLQQQYRNHSIFNNQHKTDEICTCLSRFMFENGEQKSSGDINISSKKPLTWKESKNQMMM